MYTKILNQMYLENFVWGLALGSLQGVWIVLRSIEAANKSTGQLCSPQVHHIPWQPVKRSTT